MGGEGGVKAIKEGVKRSGPLSRIASSNFEYSLLSRIFGTPTCVGDALRRCSLRFSLAFQFGLGKADDGSFNLGGVSIK